MHARTLGFLLLVAALAACSRPGTGGEAAPPARPNYLAGVPLIPQSIITDTTGTPEAQHRGLVLQKPLDSVAAFYRRELVARGWRIIGDVSDTARVSLYLQKDSLSLWVQIHSIGRLATEYALTATGGGTTAPGAPH